MTTDTALKMLKSFSIASGIINPFAIPLLVLNYKNKKEEVLEKNKKWQKDNPEKAKASYKKWLNKKKKEAEKENVQD